LDCGLKAPMVVSSLWFGVKDLTYTAKMPSPISLPEFIGACAGATWASLVNFYARKPMSAGIPTFIAIDSLDTLCELEVGSVLGLGL
jgi:hypothetical protein